MKFGRVQRAYLGIKWMLAPRGSAWLHPNGRWCGSSGASTRRSHPRRERHRSVLFSVVARTTFQARPGDKVRLDVRRQGARRQMEVTLTDHEDHRARRIAPSTDRRAPRDSPRHRLHQPRRAEHWEFNWKRLLLLEATIEAPWRTHRQNMRDGAWERQGLRRGFILLRIDGRPVLTSRTWNSPSVRPNETDKMVCCSRACTATVSAHTPGCRP